MRSAFPCLVALATACAPSPGTLIDETGIWQLRTSRFRIGIRDGEPELAVLLSNGDLGCGLPSFPSDPERQAAETEALLAVACREGARHAALRLYRQGDVWVGRYAGDDRAGADTLDPERPRVAGGSYYGVEEAVLVEFDGLTRGYAAIEEIWLPVLGDAGRVEVEHHVGNTLRGWFRFPDGGGVAGEFEATRCAGDTSLLDVLVAAPVHFCL